MWKNKHEGVSAKKKKGRSTTAVKEDHKEGAGVATKEWRAGVQYTRNDRVEMPTEGSVWVCRRSHSSEELNEPISRKGYRWWKEDGGRDIPGDEEGTSEVEGATTINAAGPGGLKTIHALRDGTR